MAENNDEGTDPAIVGGPPRPQYYIASGVRRSVAAREVGLADIAANIVEPGKPDILVRIPLDQLHSPRATIYRDGRYLKVERGQLPTVELSQVKLL